MTSGGRGGGSGRGREVHDGIIGDVIFIQRWVSRSEIGIVEKIMLLLLLLLLSTVDGEMMALLEMKVVRMVLLMMISRRHGVQ